MNRWILTTIGTGLLIIGLATTSTVAAQPTSAPTPTASPSPTPQYSTGNFFKDIARDQKAIWTSPFHAKKGDLKWVVPVGLVTN